MAEAELVGGSSHLHPQSNSSAAAATAQSQGYALPDKELMRSPDFRFSLSRGEVGTPPARAGSAATTPSHTPGHTSAGRDTTAETPCRRPRIPAVGAEQSTCAAGDTPHTEPPSRYGTRTTHRNQRPPSREPQHDAQRCTQPGTQDSFHAYDVFTEAEITAQCGLPVRDGALFQILFDAGARKGDCRTLRFRHWRPDALVEAPYERLVFYEGKGGKDRRQFNPICPYLTSRQCGLIVKLDAAGNVAWTRVYFYAG